MILINDVMIDGKIHFLLWVVVGYTGVYALQSLGTVLNRITYDKLFIKTTLKLKKNIFLKLSKFEYKNYSKYEAGDLKNRLESDAGTFEKFFNSHCIDYLYAILSAVIIVVILLYMNWILAIFGVIMIPFSFLFAKVMGKKSKKISNEYREEYGYYEGFLHSAIQSWKEIKANNLEENTSKIFSNHWKHLSKLFMKTQVLGFINRMFIAFKDFFIVRMNLYFVGGLLIINDQMTVGLLLVFMSYYDQLFGHISTITESILGLKNDEPLLHRVFEILDYPIIEKEKVKISDGNIDISNLFFRYDDSQELVLKNVNIAIQDKEHIAIAGRSGCGKTTLSKLILGMYEPESGTISIGGYDISKIGIESIGQKISVVMQEPILFNLTIRENLLIAKKSATQKELDDACKRANILEFIQSLPDNYETIIGEKGIKLSGGQKQRVAIARTILLDSDIIIFDEATSSLDHISEKAILSSIKTLSKEKTIISIAHRLSSILETDRVIIMDNGEIITSGKHNELKGENAIYDILFQAQYVAEGEKEINYVF
jgi:ATP-binding cassette subfamily B protein/subfamily B ATP-binding cassette protein MsbA